tara:strand:- start:1935 stop:2039 length:105 start_codon:yes stop_codon:yes gene_type:complete
MREVEQQVAIRSIDTVFIGIVAPSLSYSQINGGI